MPCQIGAGESGPIDCRGDPCPTKESTVVSGGYEFRIIKIDAAASDARDMPGSSYSETDGGRMAPCVGPFHGPLLDARTVTFRAPLTH